MTIYYFKMFNIWTGIYVFRKQENDLIEYFKFSIDKIISYLFMHSDSLCWYSNYLPVYAVKYVRLIISNVYVRLALLVISN